MVTESTDTARWQEPTAPAAEREFDLPAARARQTLALLPILRRWVTARVQLAGAGVDLSLRQYAALHGIREGASSPGELARLWQVTPAVLTGIVDRLERRGLVRREIDPGDRRRLRLALTPEGILASEEVERALTGDLAAQLATASADELAELGRALDLLQRTFSALEERTRQEPPAGEEDDLPMWTEEESVTTTRADTKTAPTATETGNGVEDQTAQDDVVVLDVSDPQFMATAYDTYAELRERGPVTRIKFASREEDEETAGPRERLFRRPTFFVTHYDDVVETLLDDRLVVNPGTLMAPEEREKAAAETPEEFRPFSRSLIALDPPDHTHGPRHGRDAPGHPGDCR